MKLSSTLKIAMALVAGLGTAALRADAPETIKHRTNEYAHLFDGAPTAGSTGTLASPLINNGGPVFGTPTVYIIWYGNWAQTNGTDTAAGQQIVRDFFNSVGGSPYFKLNATYPAAAGQSQITGNVTFGSETSVAYPYKTRVTDSNFASIVSTAITTGKLPNDSNGIYFVLTSSDVTASSGFCTKYCGWHTHRSIAGSDIKYSFVGNAARCITSCAAQSTGPNGNAGVDGMISVIAHELEEAVSDADISAWKASGGAENGDSCAWTFGATQQASNGAYYNMTMGTRNYLIQRNVKMANGSATQTCDIK